MNKIVKGFLGGALFGSVSLLAGYSISQIPKEFDPITAPICSVSNNGDENLALKVTSAPPLFTGFSGFGTFFLYPKKSNKALLYCGVTVSVYSELSNRSDRLFRIMKIDKSVEIVSGRKTPDDGIGGIKQKPAASGV
jgi:energy-converting hydrogenase Eha subunit G